MRTATEIDAVMQGIADVLQPFARHECKHWELAWRIAGQYREIADLNVSRSYPEEMDISTLPELIASYDQVRQAGVGYDVLAAMRNRIQEKTYEGNPEQQRRVLARYHWLPFDDKSPEEVAMILSARSPLDPDRILYENWLTIFRMIDDEEPGFADMTRQRQQQIIDAKIEEIKSRIILVDQVPGDAAAQANPAPIDINPPLPAS